MKKLYTILFLLPLFAFAQTFPGNGNTGFGGGIGGSALTVSDNGTTVSFSLAAGSAGFNGNNLILYVDNNQGGGYANTSTFTDQQDGGRTAISGVSTNGRTLINFPTGFRPQLAISVEYGFVGLFNLATPANFTYINSGGYAIAGNVITFSFSKGDLGIMGSVNFKFFGTLISSTAFRSNEAIGSALTDPAPAAPNYGFTGTINPATFNTYAGTVLAISISRFSGVKQGANTLLQWNTATESNVAYFGVEQSENGRNWNEVARQAAGNTATGAAYSATVRNSSKDVNYYRLRSVSGDGSFSYSNIVTIQTRGAGNIALINSLVQNRLRFTVAGASNSMVKATVYNTDGRSISSSEYRISGAGSIYELPADQFPKGMYFLRVISGSETAAFPFVKQ